MEQYKMPNETEGEIVLYQPDENIKIEVHLQDETVWLAQQQMAQLFDVKENTITYHIKEIYKNQELEEISTARKIRVVRIEGNRKVNRQIDYYNLDMILSIGYRVNSVRGIKFRRWSSNVLKQYLLRGYSINQQILSMQHQIDSRLDLQSERMFLLEQRQNQQQQQLDFFIRTSTPPAEMVFFNGEFFSARVALENLIKSATRRVIIIDGYIDARTFDILGTREAGVVGQIYTVGVGAGITRLRDEYNRQQNVDPIEVFKWKKESHDRWLIIDDRLYHCGHSLNAIGNKMSAITLMGRSPDEILDEVR